MALKKSQDFVEIHNDEITDFAVIGLLRLRLPSSLLLMCCGC
jgi:hypothetical protein